MKKLILVGIIAVAVVGCLQTGNIKIKTPDANYEFEANTNGIATIVISNGNVVVEFEGE